MKAVFVIDVDKDELGEAHATITANDITFFAEGVIRPLPKGHGDLIDRQALINNGINKGFCDWYDEIKMADTIIEADTGETE